MACDPCERGEHRFCVVGNCDFCPACKRSRERATQTPEPTPEQAVRVLKILGEWTRRGFTYEVENESGNVPLGGPRIRVVFSNPDVALEAYSPDPPFVTGVNHFDALCQATTAMQGMLELSDFAKSEE